MSKTITLTTNGNEKTFEINPNNSGQYTMSQVINEIHEKFPRMASKIENMRFEFFDEYTGDTEELSSGSRLPLGDDPITIGITTKNYKFGSVNYPAICNQISTILANDPKAMKYFGDISYDRRDILANLLEKYYEAADKIIQQDEPETPIDKLNEQSDEEFDRIVSSTINRYKKRGISVPRNPYRGSGIEFE